MLKIEKITTKPQTVDDQMWQYVSKDETLNALFNRKHPFLEYELLDLSDSLNFSVAIGTRKVYGSAFVYDYRNALSNDEINSRTRISFGNVIRNLIFNTGDQRVKDVKFIVEKNNNPTVDDAVLDYISTTPVLNIQSITEYLQAAVDDFGFIVEYEFGYHHCWYFTKEGVEPLMMFIPSTYVEKCLKNKMVADNLEATTKSYIQNLTVRLFLEARSEQDSKEYVERVESLGKDAADRVLQVKESIRNAVKRQAEALPQLRL